MAGGLRNSGFDVLPDAAAVQSGAALFHRAGLTGRGVHIALVDSGCVGGHWFSDRGFRLTTDGRSVGDHAIGMAALLFAVAPDAHVCSITVDDVPAEQVVDGLASADLVVAAWGSPSWPGVPLDLSRCLTVRNPARREWPGHADSVHVVGPDTPWPTGPFTAEHLRAPIAGLSVAAGIVSAFAALLVQGGASPHLALERVCSGRPGALVPPLDPGCSG